MPLKDYFSALLRRCSTTEKDVIIVNDEAVTHDSGSCSTASTTRHEKEASKSDTCETKDLPPSRPTRKTSNDDLCSTVMATSMRLMYNSQSDKRNNRWYISNNEKICHGSTALLSDFVPLEQHRTRTTAKLGSLDDNDNCDDEQKMIPPPSKQQMMMYSSAGPFVVPINRARSKDDGLISNCEGAKFLVSSRF
jgi:hypothetical protein